MKKRYECGLVIGRFQNPHIGHDFLFEEAKESCDRVLILVGSAQECGTTRNPYNIATRIKMLEDIYADDDNVMIYAIPDLTNENDNNTEWGRYLLDFADRYIYKEPDCLIYGLSKEEEGRATTWFDVDKLENMRFLLVPRNVKPVSATMVRDLMVRNDRRQWMRWVNPRLHKYYDKLRNELMTVPYYAELEKKYRLEGTYNYAE